jgi:hypothetical protein
MVVFNNAMAGAAGSGGAAAGYQIERSLRFHASDSSNIQKTFTTAGNRRLWTWSGWVKRSILGTTQHIFGAQGTSNADYSEIYFNPNDKLHIAFGYLSPVNIRTAQVFRDTSAWYHIVIAFDAAASAASDRLKLYVNGVENTTWDQDNRSSFSNTDYGINRAGLHDIGGAPNSTNVQGLDCYLADVHFIDGLALPASAFAEPDANGVWQPKEYINPNNGTTWSNYVTGNSLYAYGPTRAFDGNLNTQAIPDRTGTSTPSTLTFTPPSAISGKVGIYFLANTNEDDSATISINGTDVSSTLRAVQAAGGSQPWYYEFDSITSLSSIAWTAETGFDGWNVFGITINGMLLVDGWNQYNDGTFYSNYGVSINADPTPRLWTHAFDGADGSFVTGDGSSNNQSLWTYPDGITVNTSLRLKLAGGTNSFVYVNGSQVAGVTSTNASSPTWYTVTGVSNLTSIGVGNNGTTWSTLHQIEVDGTVLTDATVGRNSFHLKFNDASSKDALGTDSANGNNWTVNNIIASSANTLSNASLTMTVGDDSENRDLSRAFDGSTSTFIFASSFTKSTLDLTVSFTTPLSISSTLEFYWIPSDNCSGTGRCSSFSINGGGFQTAPETQGTWTWHNISSPPSSLSTFTLRKTSSNVNSWGNFVTLAAIRIDGTIVTLTTPEACDSLFDSPTNGTQTDSGLGGELSGNYATWNPLHSPSQVTISQGNLNISAGAGSPSTYSCNSTFGMSSGKWYWEATAITAGTNSNLGISKSGRIDITSGSGTGGYAWQAETETKVVEGANTSGYGTAATTGSVVMFALDMDNLKFYVGKDGTWFDLGNPVTGANPFSTVSAGTYLATARPYAASGTCEWAFNWGQRPFAHAAPTGFKSVCTANLPTPDIEDGSTAFDVVTYDGQSGNKSIDTLSFKPEFLWVKSRNLGASHHVYDVIRGVNRLVTDDNNYQYNNGDFVSFDDNGFTLGNSSQVNSASNTYVSYSWDAGGEPTTDNVAGAGNVPTAGSVKIDGNNMTSALPGTVPVTRASINTTAGFSVVSYNAGGTSGTVYHGLPKPGMILLKNYGSSYNWSAWIDQNGTNAAGYLDLNDQFSGTNNAWLNFGSQEPSANVFNVANYADDNDPHIAYVWTAVEGYSAFNVFTGGGSTNKFIYTGFRPRWIMFKETNDPSGWAIWDSERSTYNTNWLSIDAAYPDIEQDLSGRISPLSNGFYVHTTFFPNVTNNICAYAAFAEHPFRHSRAR